MRSRRPSGSLFRLHDTLVVPLFLLGPLKLPLEFMYRQVQTGISVRPVFTRNKNILMLRTNKHFNAGISAFTAFKNHLNMADVVVKTGQLLGFFLSVPANSVRNFNMLAHYRKQHLVPPLIRSLMYISSLRPAWFPTTSLLGPARKHVVPKG